MQALIDLPRGGLSVRWRRDLEGDRDAHHFDGRDRKSLRRCRVTATKCNRDEHN